MSKLNYLALIKLATSSIIDRNQLALFLHPLEEEEEEEYSSLILAIKVCSSLSLESQKFFT